MQFLENTPRREMEGNPDELVFESGKKRLVLNVFLLRADLAQVGIDQSAIVSIMDRIQKFSDEVKSAKAQGMGIDSMVDINALISLFWEGEPGDMGLQTPLEQKLVGQLVGRSCKESTK